MIDTVLFDMGGTLEDIYMDEATTADATAEVLRILKEHGVAVDRPEQEVAAELLRGWKRYNTYRDPVLRELKPDEIWGDYVLTGLGIEKARIADFAEELAHSWEVTYYRRAMREGVPEMLAGLKEMGMKLGVISNTASLFQVFDVLEQYGIRDYFDDVTLSSVTGYRKPHPYIFMVSLRQLQVEPAACAYVGDTVSRDVVGPQKMGFGLTFQIHSFLTNGKDAEADPNVRPSYLIPDIRDVLTILKKDRK